MGLLNSVAIGALTTAVVLTAAPNLAFAQAADDTPAVLDEIVVTARRREEALQTVPVAVTAFSAKDLASANVARMENLTTVVPSLNVSPSQHRNNVPGFAIRGQRQDAGFLTNDPSVGIYIAEAVQARNFGLGQSLFDLESVQVLKGPQGTLFGRNTTGGAILFQPRRPDLTDFGGYVQGRLGNYDRADLLAVVNAPISDVLGLRVGVNRTHRRGYVHDVARDIYANAENTWSARAILLFKPSDSFSNTLYLDHVQATEPGGAGTRLTAVNPALGINATLGPVLASQTARLGFYDVEGNYPNPTSKGMNSGVTNVTEWDVMGVTLKNIANYRKVKMMERTDLDGTTLSILHLEQTQSAEQYSNEFQIQGEAFGERLKWITGAYWFKEEGLVSTFTSANGGVPAPRYGWAENMSSSLFAQADFQILDQLSLTLGGRYTWDRRSIDQKLLNAATLACTFCKVDEVDFKAPTYTASLNWQITPDKLLYVANRTGYRSGGFNSSGNTAAALQAFAPEYVTDYEVGLKADWDIGGMPLRTNIAAFHSLYKGIQRTVIRTVNNVPVTTIFNAASATIDGGEIEATFKPTPDLEFQATASFVNPRYKKFDEITANGTIDRSMNTFAYIPHNSYRLGVRWTLPWQPAGDGEVNLSADYYWQTGVYMAEVNQPWNYQKGYGLLSGRLEWTNAFKDGLTLALWGRNLTGTEFYSTAGDSYLTSGYVYRGLGEPRTFGGEAQYVF